MNKWKMYTFLFLFPILIASEQFVYISHVEIEKKNEAGKHWDGFYGKPDIIVAISIWQNSKWINIFNSEKFQDTFEIENTISTEISIDENQKMQFSILDKDLQKSDAIGSTDFIVTKSMLSGKKQSLSFGLVKGLTFFTRPYKNKEQKEIYWEKQLKKISTYEKEILKKDALIQKYQLEINELHNQVKKYQQKYGTNEFENVSDSAKDFAKKQSNPNNFSLYRDITSLFSLQYPQAWRISHETQDGFFSTIFTADNKDEICIETFFNENETRLLTITEQYKSALPAFLDRNSNLKEKSFSIYEQNGNKVVKAYFSVDEKKEDIEIHFTQKNYVQFFVLVKLSATNYNRYWQQIQKNMQFFPSRFINKRKEQRVVTSEVVQTAKEATVLVHAEYDNNQRGTGTGWFIHPSGYIITNHHVCYNHKNNRKQAKNLYVSWDSGVAKKKVQARLVASWYQEKPVRKDIALLKIEGEGHAFLPIAMPKHTLESDRILALGFPRTDVFGGNDITITEGTIIRLVENIYGKLDVIYIDAQITSGNSGGPCYDLNLGGVVGVNTAIHTGSLHGYNITLPISIAVEEFPEVLYPHDRPLEVADHFKLALYYKSQKWYRGAVRELLELTRLQPENDLFWALLGKTLLHDIVFSGTRGKKPQDQAVSYLKKALNINPKNFTALTTLGIYYKSIKDSANALIYYNRLVSFYSENSRAYVSRAQLYMREKRYEQARKDALLAIKFQGSSAVEAHLILAQIFYKEQHFTLGKEQYQKALDINPHSLPAHLGKIAYYLHRKEYLSAEIEYTLLLDKYPNNTRIELTVARFYYSYQKNAAKALSHYQQALQIFKKQKMTPNLAILRMISSLAREQKKYELALETYFERLRLETDVSEQFDVYVGIGHIYFLLKKQAYSDAYYCLAFATSPKNKRVKNFLGDKKLTPLSVADLNELMLTQPSQIIAKIILVADLDFTYTKKQIQEMATKLPMSISNSLLLRAKNKWKPLRPKFKEVTNKINRHLTKNGILKVAKFYTENNNWYVDFSFTNNNKIAISNLQINANLQDQNRKTIKVVFLDPKETLLPGQTINYTKIYLVPFVKYAHARFLYLQLYNAKESHKLSSTQVSKTLNFAVGNLQGTYYEKGRAMQQLFAKENFILKLKKSPGAFKNLLTTAKNEVDIAFTQFDSWLATAIDPQLKKQISQVAVVTPVGTEEIHILVHRNARIKSLQDLEGKTVHLGADSSGTSITAGILLNMAGVNVATLTPDYSSPQLAIQKLLRGEIDAMFYTVGAPVALFKKVDKSYADVISLLELQPEVIANIQKKSTGIYDTTTIKSGTYPWLKKDTVVLNTLSLLIANRSQSVATIKRIFELILKNKDVLQKSHASWGIINEDLLKRIPQYYLHEGVK
ncbi:TAXI family TRAP transporter solute-binding subunit [Candidatus Uabimicrobium sp. HlEnr_7]|uniref:TAXI family TRAP transporter solute-binding subunit n=1 Tax=Candidatus Uabimicrobium helgolandensis TaxID=3095367 RepID=UPI003555D9EF